MTPEQARTALVDAFLDVAPDSDPTSIPGDQDYRQALSIDSMDFLNILELVAERTGVEVPEADYPKIQTFDAFIAYLGASA